MAIAVTGSTYLISGLDVCPPVQEDLGGPEAASISSPVEGSTSMLSKQQVKNIYGIQKVYIPNIHKYRQTFIHTIYECMYV